MSIQKPQNCGWRCSFRCLVASIRGYFKIPILQMEDPVQVTCRGAALIGLSRMGYLSQDEIPDRVKVRKTFEPNEANFAMYDKLFDQFKLILKTNRKIFNSLNE